MSSRLARRGGFGVSQRDMPARAKPQARVLRQGTKNAAGKGIMKASAPKGSKPKAVHRPKKAAAPPKKASGARIMKPAAAARTKKPAAAKKPAVAARAKKSAGTKNAVTSKATVNRGKPGASKGIAKQTSTSKKAPAAAKKAAAVGSKKVPNAAKMTAAVQKARTVKAPTGRAPSRAAAGGKVTSAAKRATAAKAPTTRKDPSPRDAAAKAKAKALDRSGAAAKAQSEKSAPAASASAKPPLRRNTTLQTRGKVDSGGLRPKSRTTGAPVGAKNLEPQKSSPVKRQTPASASDSAPPSKRARTASTAHAAAPSAKASASVPKARPSLGGVASKAPSPRKDKGKAPETNTSSGKEASANLRRVGDGGSSANGASSSQAASARSVRLGCSQRSAGAGSSAAPRPIPLEDVQKFYSFSHQGPKRKEDFAVPLGDRREKVSCCAVICLPSCTSMISSHAYEQLSLIFFQNLLDTDGFCVHMPACAVVRSRDHGFGRIGREVHLEIGWPCVEGHTLRQSPRFSPLTNTCRFEGQILCCQRICHAGVGVDIIVDRRISGGICSLQRSARECGAATVRRHQPRHWLPHRWPPRLPRRRHLRRRHSKLPSLPGRQIILST